MNNSFPAIGSLVEQTASSKDILTGSDGARPLHEIESLCMRCEEMVCHVGPESLFTHTSLDKGVTRMLLTSIPFFREVIVTSFRCEHCGNSNNEVQSAGTIQRVQVIRHMSHLINLVVVQGTIYTVRVSSPADLNRQIVRSPTCSVNLPEYELTLPANRGQLTTIEGLIRDIIGDLSLDQTLRRIEDESTYAVIENLLTKLRAVVGDRDDDEKRQSAPGLVEFLPFTIELDDPSGNSFIEFIGSIADSAWNMRKYERTRQQDVKLGLASAEEQLTSKPAFGTDIGQSSSNEAEDEIRMDGPEVLHSDKGVDEVYTFDGLCPRCKCSLQTRVKKVIIPYFKVSPFNKMILFMPIRCRTSSSCPQIAISAGIETMRSSLDQPSLRRESELRFR
jgi:zinc finger protein